MPPVSSIARHGDYTVAIICAMAMERTAVLGMFDEEHQSLPAADGDPCSYSFGSIHGHRVVLASLPGTQGKGAAAIVATHMQRTFKEVKIWLFVGIGGGVPSEKHDVRLGDVVVSMPEGQHHGLIQYDLGKETIAGYQTKGFLMPVPTILRSAVETMKSRHSISDHRIEETIFAMVQRHPKLVAYQRPLLPDIVFQSNYEHPPEPASCENCDVSKQITRHGRPSPKPKIHYGLVATGDSVIKTAKKRDEIVARMGDILCFEMEAAGLMSEIPGLAIRGISDYADSHKNDDWHKYAAATAAACAKEVLSYVPLQTWPRHHEDVFDFTEKELKEYDDAMRKLSVTNPEYEKARIERVKGGLMRESYKWIIRHDSYCEWSRSDDNNFLWIRGDPGKGKTMLLCGIVDELSRMNPQFGNPVYFFCQATDSRLNSAEAVVKGLLFGLLKRGSLKHKVLQRYKQTGNSMTQEIENWDASCHLLEFLLQSNQAENCLIVDGLDECTEGLERLLQCITRLSTRGKLLVSSRNWPTIEDGLSAAIRMTPLRLELNPSSIEEAVQAYIEVKANEIAEAKGCNEAELRFIKNYLSSNAHGTFLWVALVCEELQSIKVRKRRVKEVLQSFPSGLNQLYHRMANQIFAPSEDSADTELRRQILCFAALAAQPVSLEGVRSLIGASQSPLDTGDMVELVELCGSFLALRDEHMYFVHQSAKDFVMTDLSTTLFPRGIHYYHGVLGERCVQVLSSKLRRNLYQLDPPTIEIYDILVPNPDPLESIHYASLHWGHHFIEASSTAASYFWDHATIHLFAQTHLLHWLEALILSRQLQFGFEVLKKLCDAATEHLEGGGPASSMLTELLQDALRFCRHHFTTIQRRPLQLYGSALLHSPRRSIVRRLFESIELDWISMQPYLEEDWPAQALNIDTLYRTDQVLFSPSGALVATMSSSGARVDIWDPLTGQSLIHLFIQATSSMIYPQSTVQTARFYDMKWSSDERLLILGRRAGEAEVRIWELQRKQVSCLASLSSSVLSDPTCQFVSLSPTGDQVAVLVQDLASLKLLIWDIITGENSMREESYKWSQRCQIGVLTFSPDGQYLAVRSEASVHIWDRKKRSIRLWIPHHADQVFFSANSTWIGALIASQAIERESYPRFQLFRSSLVGTDTPIVHCNELDLPCGNFNIAIPSHEVCCAVFYGIDDKGVFLTKYNLEYGICYPWTWDNKAWDHSDPYLCIANMSLSPDATLLVIRQPDASRLRIHDISTLRSRRNALGALLPSLLAPSKMCRISISADETKFLTSHEDGSLSIWATSNLQCLVTWTRSSGGGPHHTASFSPDGMNVASIVGDETAGITDGLVWSNPSYASCPMEWIIESRYFATFSPFNDTIAVQHRSCIQIWGVSTGRYLRQLAYPDLEAAEDPVQSKIAYSPNGEKMALVMGKRIWIWNLASQDARPALIHEDRSLISSISFSPDSLEVAMSADEIILILDATTGSARGSIFSGFTPTITGWNSSASAFPGIQTLNGVVTFNVGEDQPAIGPQRKPELRGIGAAQHRSSEAPLDQITWNGKPVLLFPRSQRGSPPVAQTLAVSGGLLVVGFDSRILVYQS